jgi:hypothetical protein
MKIIDGSWSVVIVGKWNRYILTPEWVGKEIFNQDKLEVQFPVNRPELPLRYKNQDNILFLPAIDKCQFIAQESYDDATLSKISSFIKNLVSILKHTPVTAFGINFGFEEESHNFNQLNLFNFNDSNAYLDKKIVPSSTEIKRQFAINKHLMNLSVIYDSNQNKVFFNFNFHYDVTKPSEINELVTKDLIIKKESLKILDDIYNLKLENEEENNE